MNSLTSLKRYSKPRGAGDQTSGGRGKLLRPTSDLSRVGIVVRETLQNSWDARDEAWYPAYGVRVYQVAEQAKRILQERIFTDLPVSLRELAQSLQNPDLHAIEIYDRGTSGLNGPYRATDVALKGTPNNFNSFVFDIGTTKASETSGGTFGFGKTAAFEVSKVHSVVYWTRCLNSSGEHEYRLIAASLHEPYDENNARFTGAHWWGELVPATMNPHLKDIVPIVGDEAQRLGELLFHVPFGDEGDSPETGTSILILDPVISVKNQDDEGSDNDQTPLVQVPVRHEQDASELLKQISDALTLNAWPKTIPLDDDGAPMLIELYRNEEELNVAERIRRESQQFANALVKVREAQDQQKYHDPGIAPQGILEEKTFPIRLRPVYKQGMTREDFFGTRNDNVVGHLHLSLRVKDIGGASLSHKRNALCLMRSGAELVVKYEEIIDSLDDALEWHGVFKPTPECDKHFSASEPPTHDSWNPRSGTDNEISAYVVEKALGQIRQKTRDFLSAHQTPQKESTRSVRGVATGLREFVPFGNEPEATNGGRGRSSGGGGKRTAATQAEVVNSRTSSENQSQIQVRAKSKEGADVKIHAIFFAVTSEGRMSLTDDEVDVTWQRDGETVSEGKTITLENGHSAELIFRPRVEAAIEIDLRTESAK